MYSTILDRLTNDYPYRQHCFRMHIENKENSGNNVDAKRFPVFASAFC